MDIMEKAREIADDYNAELAAREEYPSGMGLHRFIIRAMSVDHSYNEMNAVEREAGKIIWPHTA